MKYEDPGIFSTRTFELIGDKIRFQSHGFRGAKSADVLIPVASLRSDPGRVWTRDTERHTIALATVVAASIVAVAVLALFAPGKSSAWSVAVEWMVGALLLVAAYAALDPRRIEHAVFNNQAGGVELTFAKHDSQADRFEEFTQALVAAIRASGSAKDLKSDGAG